MSNINWQQTLTLTAAHYRKYPQHIAWDLAEGKDRTAYPNAAGYKTNGASKEAAEKIDRKRVQLHDMVLKALAFYPEGATAEQIANFLERPAATIKPRLSELRQFGEVKRLEERGITELGGSCHKWALNTCNSTLNKDN